MKTKQFFLFALLAAGTIAGCKKPVDNSVTTDAGLNNKNHLSTLSVPASGTYGTYRLVNKSSGKSAQIYNFSLDNGGTVNQVTYAGTQHQKWRITNNGSGYYTIMNLGSGKLIQADTVGTTNVINQKSATGLNAQLWAITVVTDTTYKIINKSNGLAMTLDGIGNINTAAYTGATTQLWYSVPIATDGYRDDQVVNFFHRTSSSMHSVAWDQGNSIPLTDGRSLWITEDAWDGSSLTTNGDLACSGTFSYRNSVLIQPASHSWDPTLTNNLQTANPNSGKPLQVFNIQTGMDWTWPGQGIDLGDTVYVAAGEGTGTTRLATSFYKMTKVTGSTTWPVARVTIPQANSNTAGINYGTGFVKASDGYVYVFGSKSVGFDAFERYVARFPATNFYSWTFWNGTSWVSTPVAGGSAVIANTKQNVAFSFWKGKYIKMQLDYGYDCDPTSHVVYLSASSNPTGPWPASTVVFTIQDRVQGHLLKYYTPAIHPEFDNGKNELLLTYSVNFTACTVSTLCSSGGLPSYLYQIKGVRVPASMIGL